MGFPIGGSDEPSFYIMETHIDNPSQKSGIIYIITSIWNINANSTKGAWPSLVSINIDNPRQKAGIIHVITSTWNINDNSTIA